LRWIAGILRALSPPRAVTRVASAAVVAATVVSFLPMKRSWIRMWDFPRLQLAIAGTVLIALAKYGSTKPTQRLRARPHGRSSREASVVLDAALLAAVAYQWLRVWRYTPAAPREVRRAARSVPRAQLSIVEANVMLSNRDAGPLLRTLRRVSADVIICAETDAWWCAQLDELGAQYPFSVSLPLDNTYGMALLSRLPLAGARIEFLTDLDVPSIHAQVRLRNGTWVWLHGLHPRPPVPYRVGSSLQRDSELLLVARRVRNVAPVIVFGDLNDVAWSRTTRLFQKISRLLDPRKGRGFYATYNAFWPGLRFPLDHVYHSADFELVDFEVLESIGSDHFPMYIRLQHARSAAEEQQAPVAEPSDLRRLRRTLSQARSARQS
jgi:endonuclease/exonuclease/phosphatase (EEP) superfamily protein YafD